MCNYSFFYNTCYKNRAPEKWRFWSLQSLLLVQFSTYRQRTGFIVKRKQVHMPNWFLISINLKKYIHFYIWLICPKNMCISKNSIKFIIISFQKMSNGHMYICTKGNDNFKFLISLKSYEEYAFPWVPPHAGLFSITRFLNGWQKIFTNKNVF